MSIRSTCEKGFKVYLAEQHRDSMDNALGKGVLIGGLCSGLFYDHSVMNLSWSLL